MHTRAGRSLLLAAGLAAGLVGAASAETSGAIQFWLQQAAPAPAAAPTPPRQAPRTIFRPRHPHLAARAERRASPGPQAAVASKPGFVVAVFGDSFGFDAARGLTDLYDDVPRAGVSDETSDAASLAGPTLPVWGDGLADAIRQAGRVDAAVLMLGTGDLRPMADGHGAVAAPDSEAWRQIYADRVRSTAAFFRDRKVPLVWVGLPVVRDDDLARRYAGLNAIVRENAAGGGYDYVDSWAAFADDDGHFATAGPDQNGQPAKLRREDGRRFTRAGARKLAGFIMPALKRIADKVEASARLASLPTSDADVFDQALAIDVNAQIRREAGLPPLPSPSESRDGLVTDLTAPPTATGGHLANAGTPVALAATAESILSSGLTPSPRRGRADDFAWPRASP